MRPSLLAFLVVLVVPAGASGWGTSGHRITGEIAWQYLGETNWEIRGAMLDALPDRGRYRTLYETTTWPDTFARGRPQYDDMKPYHYINGDPGSDTLDVDADCGDRCVVNGIQRFANDLCDDTPTNDVFALRWLSHLVGDIHQPLHVSHPDNRGGNRTDVTFKGKAVNLHKLWDTTMIEEQLEEYESWDFDEWEEDADLGDQMLVAWHLYALELFGSASADEKKRWSTDLDPAAWAQESRDLAETYAFDVSDGDSLGSAYYNRAMPVIAQRLQQSGIRMAALLEAVFDGAAARPDWLTCGAQ